MTTREIQSLVAEVNQSQKNKPRLLAYKNEDLLARQVGEGDVEEEEEERMDLTSIVMRMVLSPLLLPLFLFYAFCFPKRSNYEAEMAKIRQEDRVKEQERIKLSEGGGVGGVGDEGSNSYPDYSDSSDENSDDDEDEQQKTFAESMMAAYSKSVACIIALDVRLRRTGPDAGKVERRGSAMTVRTKIARESKYVQAIDVARTDRIIYPYDGVFVKNIFVDIKDSTRLKELIRRLSIAEGKQDGDGDLASSSLLSGRAEDTDEAKATSLMDSLIIQANQMDPVLAIGKKPTNQRKSSFGNILGGGPNGAKVVPSLEMPAGEEEEASPETDNQSHLAGGGGPPPPSSSSPTSSSPASTPLTTKNSSKKKPKKTSLEGHGDGGIRVNPQVATRLPVEGPSINSLEQALMVDKDSNSPLRDKIRQQRRGWSPDSMYDDAFTAEAEAERLSPLNRLASYLPHGPDDPAGKNVVDYLILQYHQGSPAHGTPSMDSHEENERHISF